MDIKKRIQELSLDQKAKLYFMGLVRQGKIDRLPEDPKAAYVSMMMDKDDYAGMEESKLLDRIKEKPTVEERTAVLNYWLSKSPSRSQLPDIFDLDKENYKGNDPLILSYIEKTDQDIPYRILRQENAFFNGELIRMLNHPDDQEYIQMHKDTIVHNGVDPFGNKLTPQNHDVMADEAKADPDLAETKTLKETAIKLGYLKEMKVTDKDGNDVTSDIIKRLEKSLEKSGYKITKEEVDGMEGGIDLNAVSYEKVTFIYTEQGGRFYGLDVYENKDQPQRSAKLRYDEANEWLKDTLAYIHEGDLIPKSYNSGLEDLDLIVARLKELGIEASHGDYMDVS